MKDILENRIGKEIDVSFGAGTVSGKVVQIDGDILQLEKDDQTFFVRIEKIVALWDSKDRGEKKVKAPGFVTPNTD
ncbi:MAG TPA: MM0924 family protein [Blastocatellia bacterium]|nr:MM0924 family protein [Blastocatellia bacterium]